MGGPLEEALQDAGGGTGGGGGGLGAAVSGGGVQLQSGRRGASPEEQIAGEGTLPDEGGRERSRSMPTSPEGAGDILESADE